MALPTPCPMCGARLPPGRRLVCPACAVAGPQARVRPRRDDADDRPRRRRLADDEADDGPRPRTRRRAADRPAGGKRKRPAPVLIVGAAAGAFALLLLIGVVVYLAARDAGKPATHDLLAHAPADAVVLSGYDMEELAPTEPFRRALERRAPPDLVELDKAGLRTADVTRILVARTPNNGNTCAVRFKSAPDRAKYLGPDLPGQTYAPFTSLSGNYKFGYFADPTTLVLAEKEPAIQTLREKGGKPRLSAELKGMVDRVRGPAWRASGRVTPGEHGKVGAADDGFALRAGASAGTAAWLVPDGRLADVRFELAFDGAGQARAGATTLRGLFVQQKSLTNEFGQFVGREGNDPADFADIKRGYDQAEVTESSNRATAKLTLPASEALRAIGSTRY
jgi:hypothetical protein